MKWLKWFNWTIVIPTLLMLFLLLVLVYTPLGLRFNLWLAQQFVPELSVQQVNGSLLGGIHLQGVAFQQQDLSVSVDDVQLNINPNCIWQVKLCIPLISVSGLTLEATFAEAEETTAETKSTSSFPPVIILPIPFEITQLQLSEIQLNVNGNSLYWQSFSTRISGWGSRIQLDETNWQKIRLSLAETEQTVTTEPFQYIPPLLPELHFPLAVYISQFQLTDFVLLQEVPQKLELLQFGLQLQGNDIKLLDLLLQHDLVNLSGAAELSAKADYPLKAQFSALFSEPLAGQQLDLNVGGSFRKLQLQLNASQKLQAQMQAELQLLTANLPLTVQIQSEKLYWPLEQEPQVTLRDTSLQLSGDLTALQLKTRTDYQTSMAPDGKLSAEGILSTSEIRQLSLVVQTLGGELKANMSANWQQNPAWQTELTLADIQPGLYWPEYQGIISGQLKHKGQLSSDGNLHIVLSDMALDGKLRDFPLQLSGNLDATINTAQNLYQFDSPELVVRHGENTIKIQGSLSDEWQLKLALDLPDLADTLPEVTGTISGNAQVTGALLTPAIKASLQADTLQWQDARLAELTLQADVAISDNIQGELQFHAADASYQQQQLTTLNLSLSGSELDHQLTLDLKAPQLNTQLALTGKFERDQQWIGALNQAGIQTVQGEWTLLSALNMVLSIPQQRIDLQQHCWQQQQSQLCFDDSSISQEKGQVALQLKQFALDSLSSFIPERSQLSGTLDAQLSAQWQNSAFPEVSLTVNGQQGYVQHQFDLPVILPWQQFSLQTQLTAQQLNSELQIQFSETSRLISTATLIDPQSDNRQLQARFQLERFTLDFLKPLLDEYSQLSGVINSDLELTGNLASPYIVGHFTLDDLTIKGKLAPVDIDHARLHLDVDGTAAALNGQLKTPDGTIDLAGDLDWQDISQWQANMKIKGDELRLQIPQAQLRVKPDLTLTATPALTKVTGTVRIPSALISVDSLPESAVSLSKDLILLDAELQPLTTTAESTSLLETDLTVILEDRVRLEAFGLKTRLSGQLRVQQQAGSLRVNGAVNMLDGTFRSYGQDLLIRQGKMNFNGPADNPFLNVEAIRNPANMEDDVIAGIRVTGPADSPSAEIFSEPVKPQANALSYLLFGRDLDSSSGGSTANTITTSLIGMSIASSSKLVGEIGEAFGVRDLTLDTAGAGDNSQVTVSGYLTQDLQVKYGIGIFNAIGEFTLRYRLMRNLYLEAVSGLDNAVDLLYKFEFD